MSDAVRRKYFMLSVFSGLFTWARSLYT